MIYKQSPRTMRKKIEVGNESELGRELKAGELKLRTVVVLEKEGHPMLTTAWVIKVDRVYVHFGMGETRTIFAAARYGDNLVDDSGHRIHVYEYLGEI